MGFGQIELWLECGCGWNGSEAGKNDREGGKNWVVGAITLHVVFSPPKSVIMSNKF